MKETRLNGQLTGFAATVTGEAQVTVHLERPTPTDITATIPGVVKAMAVDGIRMALKGRNDFTVPYNKLRPHPVEVIRTLDQKGRVVGHILDVGDLLSMRNGRR